MFSSTQNCHTWWMVSTTWCDTFAKCFVGDDYNALRRRWWHFNQFWYENDLTHWGLVSYICRNMLNHSHVGLFKHIEAEKNGRHFPDDIFKCIFFNENVWIPIQVSLKFVPKGPIKNIPALVRIMAWRRPGDKPLSDPTMARFPTHICVTRPQWAKMFIAASMICYNRRYWWWYH